MFENISTCRTSMHNLHKKYNKYNNKQKHKKKIKRDIINLYQPYIYDSILCTQHIFDILHHRLCLHSLWYHQFQCPQHPMENHCFCVFMIVLPHMRNGTLNIKTLYKLIQFISNLKPLPSAKQQVRIQKSVGHQQHIHFNSSQNMSQLRYKSFFFFCWVFKINKQTTIAEFIFASFFLFVFFLLYVCMTNFKSICFLFYFFCLLFLHAGLI